MPGIVPKGDDPSLAKRAGDELGDLADGRV
jgi:hypothetical protein